MLVNKFIIILNKYFLNLANHLELFEETSLNRNKTWCMRSGVGAQHCATNAAPSARHQPRNEPAVVDSRLRDSATVTGSPHHGDGQSRPA